MRSIHSDDGPVRQPEEGRPAASRRDGPSGSVDESSTTSTSGAMAGGGGEFVLKVPRTLPSGIGAARRFCVQHARRLHLPSIICRRTTHNGCLGRLSRRPSVPRSLERAVRSIHDHFTAGAISRNSGVIMCPGGWGFQTFGLNTRTAHEVGNFDSLLHSYGEDGELAVAGISPRAQYRTVHGDVKVAPIGARYAPGGINTRFKCLESRTRAERECLALIHMRWPKYTNEPDRPLRVAPGRDDGRLHPGSGARGARSTEADHEPGIESSRAGNSEARFRS